MSYLLPSRPTFSLPFLFFFSSILHFFLLSPFLLSFVIRLFFLCSHSYYHYSFSLGVGTLPSFSGSKLTIKTYSEDLCRGTVTTETVTLDACVATAAPTSSSQSLGYAQWSYANSILAPQRDGYINFQTFAVADTCRSPSLVESIKLNECLIDSSGYGSISTASYYTNKLVQTRYSDRLCTVKTGNFTIIDSISFSKCLGTISYVTSASQFEPQTDTPMLVLRYSY